jgi:hypothetical protein
VFSSKTLAKNDKISLTIDFIGVFMATYIAVPLDMIQAPNNFAVLESGMFSVIQPNATTLWFILQVSDSLGQRRYIPPTGSVLTVQFMRANQFTGSFQQPTEVVQTVSKTATAHADDKSLFSVALTSQDVSTIKSGTVKFSLLSGGVTTAWHQNYALKKTLTDPGC